jgi:uncharacterized protein (DUF697 family)
MGESHDESTRNEQDSALSRRLAEYLEGAFAAVHLTRKQHFANNPGKRPSIHDVRAIIRTYANQNAVIAGSSNLVPGPWGALTIFPEITLIIRNQIQMIYDLGVAYGRDTQVTPGTLLAIFHAALGGGAISLASVQGGKLLVRRASLRVIQQIIKWLGGKITQRVLKAFLARWVPIIGAAAMALWARKSTVTMGERAADLLSREIVEVPE